MWRKAHPEGSPGTLSGKFYPDPGSSDPADPGSAGFLLFYVGVRVISFTADDLREIYTFMGDLDGLAIRYASASPDQEKLQAEVTEILEKECAAAKAADVQTWNRYSDEFHLVFTVTATTPDLQSPPNGSEAGFLFFPTSTAGKP